MRQQKINLPLYFLKDPRLDSISDADFRKLIMSATNRNAEILCYGSEVSDLTKQIYEDYLYKTGLKYVPSDSRKSHHANYMKEWRKKKAEKSKVSYFCSDLEEAITLFKKKDINYLNKLISLDRDILLESKYNEEINNPKTPENLSDMFSLFSTNALFSIGITQAHFLGTEQDKIEQLEDLAVKGDRQKFIINILKYF